MSKMRVVQITRPNTPFEFLERKIPEPATGQVRIRVEACGICHGDALTKQGTYPGIQYPRVPGHEVAGIIDAVGAGVDGWSNGQRVGVGWHGGYCGNCEPCCNGNFFACRWGYVTGITCDGGYADYIVAEASALVLLPDELSAIEAAPMVCAGVTTFNSLRNSGARANDLVAILGIGGLGHLGIQFAAKMGFNTVAIARGSDKEMPARQFGARHYIDSRSQDVADALLKLGGAKVILATVTNAKAMSAALGGLAVNGKLIVAGAPHEPLEIPASALIGRRGSVVGWYSGTAIDSNDTLSFCALTGVRAKTEVYGLERATEAYERMMTGDARFRVVLTTQ
jgi:D-arabinose 1-dehydrogenase-like Zn-dependent alcohol dehydrogenase